MSILLDKTTRVIVQGITGREGQFHTRNMKAAGTNLVGGVTPGKGGTEVEGLPVFDTVAEAKATTDAEASCIFVPPSGAADAIMEAASAGIGLIGDATITSWLCSPANSAVSGLLAAIRTGGCGFCSGFGASPVSGNLK